MAVVDVTCQTGAGRHSQSSAEESKLANFHHKIDARSAIWGACAVSSSVGDL